MSLDLSSNPELEHLNCGANNLSSLDLGQNTALTVLDCSKNQLTSLDISNNMVLGTDIWYLSFGKTLEGIHLSYMSSLNEVCVWLLPFPPDGIKVYSEGSPNVYFTDACSK
jgi:Leucine-rich repeat (LRR) protein